MVKQPQPARWLRVPERRPALPGTPLHEGGIASFTVTLPSPLRWERLLPALQSLCRTYGEHLLRLKGIIHAEDLAEPVAVHAVQHLLYAPTPLKGWQEPNPQSRLVVIGKDLDEPAVRKLLMRI